MADALDVLGGLLIEDGRTWAAAATDVQLADAAAVLAGDRPFHAISRARGYSKTTDLAAICLAAALTAPRGSRMYWAAADLDQGRLCLDSIAGFVHRSPALHERVTIGARSVVIEETGTRIDILPADAPGAWGLRPYLVVADELAQWPETEGPRRLWEALTSAMLKVKGARLVIITTAGSPVHWSAKVFESARSDDLWRVSETIGPAPWTDAAMLAEQRRRLPESVYLNLFENRWAAVEGAFFDRDQLASAFSLDGPREKPASVSHYAGLDLGLVNDRTAFVVGHREGDRVHVDLIKAWRGSRSRPVDLDEVEQFVRAAWDRYHFRLSVDPYQAIGLLQRLRARSMRVTEFNFSQSSKARLAQTLLQAVADSTLKTFDAEGLLDELSALQVRQMSSGLWTFDHTRKGHDDLATALALMLFAAIKAGSGRVAVRPGLWAPARDEESFFARHGREHADTKAHQRWSMRNHCAECAREQRERLDAEAAVNETRRQ